MDLELNTILNNTFLDSVATEDDYLKNLLPFYNISYNKFRNDIISKLDNLGDKEKLNVYKFMCENVKLENFDNTVICDIFDWCIVQIINEHLLDKEYRNALFKYCSYKFQNKYLDEFLPTKILSVKENYRKYINKYGLLQFLLNINKTNRYFDVLGNYVVTDIGDEYIKYNSDTFFLMKFYEDYDYIKYSFLTVIFHELAHAVQKRDYNKHYNYDVYRRFKEQALIDIDKIYYQSFHDYFETEIDADIRAADMFVDNKYNDVFPGVTPYFEKERNIMALNRFTKKYNDIESKIDEVVINNPRLISLYPLLNLEYNTNGEKKTLVEITNDKIYSVNNPRIKAEIVDFEDLYNHMIVNTLMNTSYKQLSKYSFSDYQYYEIIRAINYMEEFYEVEKDNFLSNKDYLNASDQNEIKDYMNYRMKKLLEQKSIIEMLKNNKIKRKKRYQ